MFEIVYRHDPNDETSMPRPTDAATAKKWLLRGNTQFSELIQKQNEPGKVHQRVIPLSMSALGISQDSEEVPSQNPFAAILSCSDARVPVELIFQQACNDLFVVRLAGNIISDECVGSIGYSIKNLGDSIKTIVVLGHTHCGAVSAAVDAYLQPATYPAITSSIGLRPIIDRVFVSVRTAAQAIKRVGEIERSDEEAYRAKLVTMSVVLNSAMMAMSLQELFSKVVSAECPVVYGIYDLATHKVWAPQSEGVIKAWDKSRLENAPSSVEEFEQLATRLASQ